MNLTRNIIQIGKKHQTPLLVVDLDRLKRNYRRIKKSIKNIEVFYAMKANDHPKILYTLAQLGASFEISSLNELKSLENLHLKPERIMCFNSIKSPEFLIYLKKAGIKVMAYDSTDEVDKIARYAPGSQLVIRINVPNEGSDWPLTKKFGVDAVDALPLLRYAKEKGLETIGVTFHVGSQCTNKNNWASALSICKDLWEQAEKEGIQLKLLSLGGGIPVQHLKKIPSIEEIGETINKAVSRNFKTQNIPLHLTIEPGRGLVGDAAILITSVVGKAKRGNENWVYIDTGVFNGLMETIEKFTYEIKTERKSKTKIVTIAGPSCDSVDIPFKDIRLPDIELDERLYVLNAGAYTSVYAAPFNGFDVPKTIFL